VLHFSTWTLVKRCKYSKVASEKAGAGGSTPSLATKSAEINCLFLIVNPSHLLEIS
jgi:hypothetical protein